MTYDAQVKAEIRKQLFAQWPPRNDAEREQLEANVRFFETQCTYEESDRDGRTIEEVASDELDAAADSQ